MELDCDNSDLSDGTVGMSYRMTSLQIGLDIHRR